MIESLSSGHSGVAAGWTRLMQGEDSVGHEMQQGQTCEALLYTGNSTNPGTAIS